MRRIFSRKQRSGAGFSNLVGLAMVGVLVAPNALADEPLPSDTDDPAAVSDPLEPVNRFTSNVNRVLRGAVIDPLVDGYQYVTPDPVERGVSNFFSNLSEPVTAVSSLLQGDTDNAATASGRFLINSTIGFLGTQDQATELGLEQRREDLGQAFGSHGVDTGPHIVLPILGPSNLRDATGDILTGLATPLPLAAQAAGGAVSYSENQDEIDMIGKGAIDPYVAEREAYEQNREFQVTNGQVDDGSFPTFADTAADPGLATTPK